MRARFKVGDRVTVLELNKSGHIRMPYYVRHKTGTVEQVCGVYLNPEDLAVGNTGGPAVPLYRVTFAQADLWPDYQGPAHDQLCIEIYDHWLAPAQAAPAIEKKKRRQHEPRAQRPRARRARA